MRISRRDVLATGLALSATALLPARAHAATPIRLTSVRSGSVGWLIDTIRAEGLDKKHGIDLDVIEVATNSAAPVALLAGEADVIVSDWKMPGRKQPARLSPGKHESWLSNAACWKSKFAAAGIRTDAHDLAFRRGQAQCSEDASQSLSPAHRLARQVPV